MRARWAIVGIGNTLAGDDGVGVWVVEAFRQRCQATDDPVVEILGGDLFAVEALLPRASHFVFVDAVAGDSPGEIVQLHTAARAFAPSLHQSDIGTVMEALKELRVADPFPTWEVWGIVIAPPEALGEGLTSEVRVAAEDMLEQLEALVGTDE